VTKPPCPHCIATGAGNGDGIMTAARAEEMAAALPLEPSRCVSGAVYSTRLERCASCAALREGVLCRWCGCFVRFRARLKAAYCPSPAGDRWQDNATEKGSLQYPLKV
jgi:hypothetical protein